MIVELILVGLAAYLIGSIPFGLLLTRMAGLGDIRAIGSGNIGATNVLRTGNKKLAALTLVLDGLKGFAAVLLAVYFVIKFMLPNYPHEILDDAHFTFAFELASAGAALAAVAGHCFPVWLRFNGGKGVATAIGAAFGLDPLIGVCALGSWLLLAITLRWSSLASLVTLVAMPILAIAMGWNTYASIYAPAFLLIALIVFWRHKENIKRLLAGTEPKIGKKS